MLSSAADYNCSTQHQLVSVVFRLLITINRSATTNDSVWFMNEIIVEIKTCWGQENPKLRD